MRDEKRKHPLLAFSVGAVERSVCISAGLGVRQPLDIMSRPRLRVIEGN